MSRSDAVGRLELGRVRRYGRLDFGAPRSIDEGQTGVGAVGRSQT